MFVYWLSNLAMGASPVSGSALTSYVDPTAVSLVAEPVATDVDPTEVTVVQ